MQPGKVIPGSPRQAGTAQAHAIANRVVAQSSVRNRKANQRRREQQCAVESGAHIASVLEAAFDVEQRGSVQDRVFLLPPRFALTFDCVRMRRARPLPSFRKRRNAAARLTPTQPATAVRNSEDSVFSLWSARSRSEAYVHDRGLLIGESNTLGSDAK